MRRRPTLPTRPIGLAAVVLVLACTPERENRIHEIYGSQPDIILVVVDALRRDHLGFYGYSRPTSPFLDSLAAEGLVFENAYSHGSETFNSTGSLLTSRYFPALAARKASNPIPELSEATALRHSEVPVLADSNETLAEALGDAGYQTVGIFTNPHHHSSSGFWQGFEWARYLKPARKGQGYARATRVHDAFFQWFDRERDARPFLAYLHFMDVHNPYRPPRFLRRQFVTVEGRDLYRNGVPTGDAVPSETDLAFMVGLYDAEIRFVDLVLENLIQDLDERGRLDQTMLIVTSDHGDEFMDRGGLGHGRHLGPEMIRIPLVIAGSKIESGRSRGMARQIDIPPTLLELAGAPASESFEGESLVPQLLEPASRPSGSRFSYARVGSKSSITNLAWHLTLDRSKGRFHLFDLQNDPRGLNDVAALHPEMVEIMIAAIDRIVSSGQRPSEAAPTADAPSAELDPEIRDQLEALGYLEP